MVAVVVGGGISGSACARALHDAGLGTRVLDRGATPGGRMATYVVAGRPVDVGAAYFTAHDPAFVTQVERWERAGLARPWTDTFAVAQGRALVDRRPGPVRWSAPQGLRSLVADLQTGLDVRQDSDVEAVDPGPQVDGEVVDAAALAMPGPQAADLLSTSLDEYALVAEEDWLPVLTLYAGWSRRCWDPELRGIFVNDDPDLDWVADDGSRRGDGAAVLVAHSTAQLAERHLDDPARALPVLVAAVRELLDIAAEPEYARVKRWSLARPAAPRREPFHLGPAMVGLCGDGWHAPSRVESAYLSGLLLGEELARRLL